MSSEFTLQNIFKKIKGEIIMENCLFCKIIKGEIPSTKVYEDEFVYSFLDIEFRIYYKVLFFNII